MDDKISKTVYSLIWPETKFVINDLANAFPHDLYEEPYLKKQDHLHVEFFDTWKNWSKPHVNMPVFDYFYPTNGSSEAIRDSIQYFAVHHPHSTLHVFEGEYEGYEAIASTVNVNVQKHDRDNWEKTFNTLKPGDRFYISQPSSIDGNVWVDFNDWISTMAQHYPEIDIWVDLCYVGCVTHNKYFVDLNYDNVAGVFFSLSKIFGVYYHRIGGVFSKAPMPGLWGNAWFKNIFSIELGKTLMKKYPANFLSSKYTYVGWRAKLLLDLMTDYSINITKSDVILLANWNYADGDKFAEQFQRVKSKRIARVCLTPGLDKLVKGL